MSDHLVNKQEEGRTPGGPTKAEMRTKIILKMKEIWKNIMTKEPKSPKCKYKVKLKVRKMK